MPASPGECIIFRYLFACLSRLQNVNSIYYYATRYRTCCTFLSFPSYRFSFLFTFPSIPDKHLEAFHVFELVLSSTLLLWYARRTAILRKFRDIMQIESICYVLALTCCLLLRFRTGSLHNISNIKGFPSERFASREKVMPAIFHFIWSKPRE